MQPEEIVILPHFSHEEVSALKVEHERREELLKGRGSYSLDEERIRDAIQRESFWRAQPESDHQQEELAHCLAIQGKLGEALDLARNLERRAYYESLHAAIVRADDEDCECESPNHTIGQFPSAKHGGRLVNMKQCPECKGLNITEL